jgi:hypothetical protein
MERYCGYLQSGLHSRSHPWANLNNRILHKSYLEQIDIYYELEDDLTITSEGKTNKWPRFDNCKSVGQCRRPVTHICTDPLSILRPPRQQNFEPDNQLRGMIAGYFQEVLGGSKSVFKAALPCSMPKWGKVKIDHGGDSIRTTFASHNPDKERNMSFVRVCRMNLYFIHISYYLQYEVAVSKANDEFARIIFYGELLCILECKLDKKHVWKSFRNQTRLLAIIRPCVTRNQDATKTLVEYQNYSATIATDLQSVQCVIGRVPRGKKWGIVDRSNDQARTVFINTDITQPVWSDGDEE